MQPQPVGFSLSPDVQNWGCSDKRIMAKANWYWL